MASIASMDLTWREKFLDAVQSERYVITVGPDRKRFEAPQSLLGLYSQPLGSMGSGNFEESVNHAINLPDDDALAFEDFLFWCYTQAITEMTLERTIDLAIFAERYLVYDLANNLSDVIRSRLKDNSWSLTPEIMQHIYENAQDGLGLRRLVSYFFAINRRGSLLEYKDWEEMFRSHPDAGWDFFKHTCKGISSKSRRGDESACRFHDHRNVEGWVRGKEQVCPYSTRASGETTPEAVDDPWRLLNVKKG